MTEIRCTKDFGELNMGITVDVAEKAMQFEDWIILKLRELQESNDILQFVAENWENEQEYDGKMETWCFYCGAYQHPRLPEEHNKDCLHLKARKILGLQDK